VPGVSARVGAAVIVAATAARRRLRAVTRQARRRWREAPDGGYISETVAVTALLVALAIAVLAVITAKVLARARGLSLG
jgi:hypothetical protein